MKAYNETFTIFHQISLVHSISNMILQYSDILSSKSFFSPSASYLHWPSIPYSSDGLSQSGRNSLDIIESFFPIGVGKENNSGDCAHSLRGIGRDAVDMKMELSELAKSLSVVSILDDLKICNKDQKDIKKDYVI